MGAERLVLYVPVDWHVKRFVDNSSYFKKGSHHKYKQLSLADHVGSFLASLLKPKTTGCYQRKSDSIEYLDIELLLDNNHKNKCYLSPDAARKFNFFMDSLIKDKAVECIETALNFGGKKKHAIEFFCEKYGLDKDEKMFYVFDKYHSEKKRMQIALDAVA